MPASNGREARRIDPQHGIYDLALDEGWVSVGIDADTTQFAVASIHSWWRHLGHTRYPADRGVLAVLGVRPWPVAG